MSLVRRESERTMRKFHKPPRIGAISSYDPKEHKVKVTFQPTGAESGWIPVTALAVGNQFGHLSAPKIGDQVKVEFQEGEHDVGRVTTRMFNKPNPPPQIQSGEYAKIHETGSGHYHKQDGTVQYAGPQFFKTGQDQPFQSGHTQTGGQNGNSQQQQQQQQQNQNAGKQCFQLNPDGSSTFNVPDPNAQGQGQPQNPRYDKTVKSHITSTSQEGNISHTAQQGSIGATAQEDITHTASRNITNSAGDTHSTSATNEISDSAPNISHNGNTSVDGDLGVSQNLSAATAGFGGGGFNIGSSGGFSGSSGGSVSGGFSTDALATSGPRTVTS